jgi:bifunctional non-homologous end joining protein LigD
MFRREWPYFYAFDLLMLNGCDLRTLPLIERKARARIMPKAESRVLFLDSIAERGCDLFRVACERDLEGVVGKWTRGTYQTNDGTSCGESVEHAIRRTAGPRGIL